MSVIAMDEMSVPPVGYEAEDGRRGADSQTDCDDDDVHSTSNGSEGRHFIETRLQYVHNMIHT